MRAWLLFPLVIFVGCGDDGGGSGKPTDAAVDTPRPIDAPIDMVAIDAPIDTPPLPANHTHFDTQAPYFSRRSSA